MSEELIIRHCSPTLAAMKTGSLFNCKFENYDNFKTAIAAWSKRLVGKGIRIKLLRLGDNSALVYIYRPKCLQRDLANKDAQRILLGLGYPIESLRENGISVAKIFKKLKVRMAEHSNFPHEVGLFLGYPTDDVECFMKRGGACCKCSGYWKVYNDEKKAKEVFHRYKVCAQSYLKRWRAGATIEGLAVLG